MFSYRFTVESDGGPVLTEDLLLDPIEDRGLPAVVEPQHHDPVAGDEGLDQSWTHLKSSMAGDRLTLAPVIILTPKKLLIVCQMSSRGRSPCHALCHAVSRGVMWETLPWEPGHGGLFDLYCRGLFWHPGAIVNVGPHTHVSLIAGSHAI